MWVQGLGIAGGWRQHLGCDEGLEDTVESTRPPAREKDTAMKSTTHGDRASEGMACDGDRKGVWQGGGGLEYVATPRGRGATDPDRCHEGQRTRDAGGGGKVVT